MRHCARLFGTLLLPFLTVSTAFAVAPIVVESRCPGGGTYVEGGTGWGNSSSKSSQTPCVSGSRSSKDAGAYADFIPTIVTEGRYDVYITWGTTTGNDNGPNAENVQVSITDRDGTVNTFVNMRGHNNCTPNSDQLIFVGNGFFQVGQGHKVRVAHTATNQCFNGAGKRYISADAVVLIYRDTVPAENSTWGTIKAMYR